MRSKSKWIKAIIILLTLLLKIGVISYASNLSHGNDYIIIESFFPRKTNDLSKKYITWIDSNLQLSYFHLETEQITTIFPQELPLGSDCENYDLTNSIVTGADWLAMEGKCGVSPWFVYFLNIPSNTIYRPAYQDGSRRGIWPDIDENDIAIWIQNDTDHNRKLLWQDLGGKESYNEIPVDNANGRRPAEPKIDYPWITYTEEYLNSEGEPQYDLIVMNLETDEKRIVQTDNSYQRSLLIDGELIAWTENDNLNIFAYNIATGETKTITESQNVRGQIASDVHGSTIIFMAQNDNPPAHTFGWNQIYSFDFDTGVTFLIEEDLEAEAIGSAFTNGELLVWDVELQTSSPFDYWRRTMGRDVDFDRLKVFLPIVAE